MVLVEIDGPPYLTVLTYLDGTPVTATTSKKVHVQVGEALRLVHEVDPSPFDEPYAWRGRLSGWLNGDLDWWLTVNEKNHTKADAVRLVLAEKWDDLENRGNNTVLLDGRPEHFLAQGTQLSGIIDLGETWVGDPIMDLAVIAINEPLMMPGVLKGYSGNEKEIADYLPLYVFLRNLSAARWCHEYGFPELAPTFLSAAEGSEIFH